MPFVIGVDTGGTFTDIIAINTQGEVFMEKAHTTPYDFSVGVMNGIDRLSALIGIRTEELLAETLFFKHGSTVATNALLTRKGAKTGFITTKGFEDTHVIMRAIGRVDGLPEDEIRKISFVTKPEPLVPMDLTKGLIERIDSSGNIVVPLNAETAKDTIKKLIADGDVSSIAVCLLHSWINPAHEKAVATLVKEMSLDKDIFLSYSHSLSSLAGEYARSNATIVNAFVGPVVQRYISSLVEKLRQKRFKGTFLIMQGNGGSVNMKLASPILNLQSGPASGVIASSYFSQLLGHKYVISTDMGGTSFDVSVLVDGNWTYADEPVFDRFRIKLPMVDVESIGAGGGTIARVDKETKRLIVGPESAAAMPGPACYEQGGTEATITDANVVLGFIDPAYFFGGRKLLNKSKAEQVIMENVAKPLGLNLVQAAASIYNIINNKMADLIRKRVIQTGYLPDEFVMYVYGGASSIHAAEYAKELRVKKLYIFPITAAYSAFGATIADVIHSKVLTTQYIVPGDPSELNEKVASIEDELRLMMEEEGFKRTEFQFKRFFTLRFRRQTEGTLIPVPASRINEKKVGEIVKSFEQKYEELYGKGSAYSKAGVEINEIRVDAIGKSFVPDLKKRPFVSEDPSDALKGRRNVYYPSEQASIETPIYEYTSLQVGNVIRGPAVVESKFTSIVVPLGHKGVIDDYSNLVLGGD